MSANHRGERHVWLLRTAIALALAIGHDGLVAQLPVQDQLVSLTEITEGGEERSLGFPRRAYVDINSQIEIVPDTAILARLTPGLGSQRVLDANALIERLNQSMVEANALLERVNGELAEALGAIAAQADQLRSNPEDEEARAGLRASLAQHARVMLDVLGFLEIRGYSKEVELGLSVADPDYSFAGELLRSDLERTREGLEAALSELEAARRDEAARLEIFAIRYRTGADPVQVHIPEYDNLPAGDPEPVAKLSFRMTEAERARVNRSHEAVRMGLQLVRGTAELGRTITRDAGNILVAVRSDLTELSRILASFPTATELESLIEEVEAAGMEEVTTALRDLRTAMQPIFELRRIHEEVKSRFDSDPSGFVPFDELDERMTSLRDLEARMADAPVIQADIDSRINRLETAIEAARQGAQQRRQDEFRRLTEDQLPAWLAATQTLADIQPKYTAAANLVDMARSLGLKFVFHSELGRTDLSPDAIAATLSGFGVSEARVSTLDLTATAPLERDRIVITSRIRDASGGEIVASTSVTVEVRTYGLHRRWSGGLGFSWEDDRDGVSPGFSTSWILHHRRRPSEGASLLSLLAPPALGVGLTSIIFSTDSQLQLGIGVTLTLFEDGLQFGVGYNIHSEEEYFFLATPLLDMLERLRN